MPQDITQRTSFLRRGGGIDNVDNDNEDNDNEDNDNEDNDNEDNNNEDNNNEDNDNEDNDQHYDSNGNWVRHAKCPWSSFSTYL